MKNETTTSTSTPKVIITAVTSTLLSKALLESESKTRSALKSFLIAGKELNTINNKELYLERGFVRWSDYVQEIFDISATYSYKLINAYGVVEALKELGFSGASLPCTESQCRPMVRLFETLDEAPVCLRDVWMRVIMSGGKITAAKVEASVNLDLGKSKIAGKVTPSSALGGTPDSTPGTSDKVNKNQTTNDILNTLGASPDSIGSGSADDTDDTQDEKSKDFDLRQELANAKAEVLRLESELIKARKVSAGVPKSKMAVELYKAGFKALAAQATPDQMDELVALKAALLG